MPNERAPDLSLFLDILRTLVDAQASALGEDVVGLWPAGKPGPVEPGGLEGMMIDE